MNHKTWIFVLTLTINTAFYAQTIPYSKGRIIISSDGNEHDHDDWAATPFTLALLAARGLQDSVTVYTFSDHEMKKGKKEMLISALQGKQLFGFKNSNFIEAVADSTKAIQAIAREINKSDLSNPLTMVAAGPMHVVGSAIASAKPSKLKYVRLISHSNWNNRHSDKPYSEWEQHSGWTWSEIKDKFESEGLVMDRITDQNGGKDYVGMKAPMHMFDWIKTSPVRNRSEETKKQMDWLYKRQLTCIKKGDFDPSDAGMIIYLLTGKEKTNPDDARKIIENPIH